MAVLVHHVSLCRWHPLGQGHSRNSLGRFMWSQCLPSRPIICTEQQTGLFVQRSPGLGVSEAGVPVFPWPWMAGTPLMEPLWTPAVFQATLAASRGRELATGLLWTGVPAPRATAFGAAVPAPWLQKETNKGRVCGVLTVWDTLPGAGNRPACGRKPEAGLRPPPTQRRADAVRPDALGHFSDWLHLSLVLPLPPGTRVQPWFLVSRL